MINKIILTTLLSIVIGVATLAQDMVSISRDIDNLKTNSAIDEETRTSAIEILTETKQTVLIANERAATVRGFEAIASSASVTITQLRDDLETYLKQASVVLDAEMNDSELKVVLTDLIAERTSLVESINTLRLRQTTLSTRGEVIAKEIAEARANVTDLQDAPPSKETTSDPLVTASLTLYSARLAERQAAIVDLTRERTTIGPRQELVDARITMTNTRIEQLESLISQLQYQLGNSRTANAANWVETSTQQLSKISDSNSTPYAFAKENVELAQANLKLIESTILLKSETNRLQQNLERITASAQTVDQVLATGQLNEETASLLRNVRTRLPNTQELTQTSIDTDQTGVTLRLNLIIWQDQLRKLIDNQGGTISDLSDITNVPQDFDIAAFSEQLVTQRHDYLQAIIAIAREKTNELLAQRSVLQTMLERTDVLTGLLDRRLLWLPTKSSFGTEFWKNIRSNISWLGSSDGWRDTGKALIASFTGLKIAPTVLALIAVILGLLAKIIRKRLLALAARVGDVRKDTYLTTPAALTLSILHTLPWPLAIAAIGLGIDKGGTSIFTQAIAQGFYAMAAVAIILGFFRTLARHNGVFHKHFGWSELSRAKFRYHLNWFIIVEVIVAFVFTAALVSGDPIVKYGIGRLAFIVSSIAIALFAFHFLKPHGGIAISISDKRKFTGTMRLMLVLLIAGPMTIGLLPVFGYYEAAIELQSRVFQSGIVILFAAIIYRLSMRFFLVGHRRLAFKRAEEKRARIKAEREASVELDQSGDAAPTIIDDKESDLDTLSLQSRRVVLIISSTVLILGLWATWSALLPALGIVNDVILWNGIRHVDGIAVSSGISLWDLTVALIFIIGGFFVARNVGGILELVFFERLSIDTGTRYAVITISKYALVSIGIVVGLSRMGLDWSSLQWVIAALGVGLGFGLQEIVANFVSGLIILFERPVRVGDIVTIGQLEGTVTSIQIRATRITDFDNREVLMPNKSIITENVTNWTLNDQITRIILRVGVAYGSDIDQVQDIILNAVTNHPDTLSMPLPVVFFMKHGDSSLDFEARVFVATPSKRLPVTHDLNRSINFALSENGIEIPFPQRDLHIKTPSTPRNV